MKKLRILAIGILAFFGIGAATVAISADRSAATSAPRSVRFTNTETAPEAQTPSVFSLSSKASLAGDMLPKWYADDGFDLRTARLATHMADGTAVIVARREAPISELAQGAHQLCIATPPRRAAKDGPESAVTGCIDESRFSVTGMTSITYRDQDDIFDVIGLVPDGVESAAIEFADGSSQAATVVNNIYTVSAASSPVATRFASPAGNVVNDIAVGDLSK